MQYISTAMSMDSVPKDLRGLRACKLCSMVKVSVHTFNTTILQDIVLPLHPHSHKTNSTIMDVIIAKDF